MKLEVGMYVRTDNGIGKYIGYNEIEFWDGKGKANYREFLKEPSHNIIDLIEVGDYLNGFRVNKIERNNTNTIIKIGNSTFNVLENEEIYTPSNDNNNGYEKIEKLKSIVTKEQFESIKYSLEG